MLFVSQFIDVPLVDSADIVAGRLIDFIARPGENGYPHILGIAYKDAATKTEKSLSYDSVENLGGDEITLKTTLQKAKPLEVLSSDIWIKKHILDQQIVDLDGTRVVRANDVRLGISESQLHVLGIDISARGLIRRLGIDKFGLFSFMKPLFIEWGKVQVVGKSLKLTKASSELVRLHPADLANVLEDLNPKQSVQLIQSLDPVTAAKFFQELQPEHKRDIFKSFDQTQLQGILAHLPADEVVDYLKLIAKDDRHQILESLGENKKKVVEEFLHYADDTAGGLMTPDFIKIGHTITVGDAIAHIRKVSKSYRTILFIYVVNEKNHLLGVVSLRTLLISNANDPIEKVMKRIKLHQTVQPEASLKDVATLMTRYNLMSLAVLDHSHKLLGAVMVDDLLGRLVPQA
ncbi:magnesium transporter [Candidatus Peregrinibacteria bacterium]|nr:magnesium transporter [Candidatus Peregrinibacteria bacterium]